MSDHTWHLSGVVGEGEDFDLAGVNPWEHVWVRVRGERADVRDPEHDQPHSFSVWTIDGPDGPVLFAAGEFAPTVFGFYLPETEPVGSDADSG